MGNFTAGEKNAQVTFSKQQGIIFYDGHADCSLFNGAIYRGPVTMPARTSA